MSRLAMYGVLWRAAGQKSTKVYAQELPSWIYPKGCEGLSPLDRTAEEYFQPCLQFWISFDAMTIEGPQSTRSGLEIPKREWRNVYESRLLSWCWFDRSLCLRCSRMTASVRQ